MSSLDSTAPHLFLTAGNQIVLEFCDSTEGIGPHSCNASSLPLTLLLTKENKVDRIPR